MCLKGTKNTPATRHAEITRRTRKHLKRRKTRIRSNSATRWFLNYCSLASLFAIWSPGLVFARLSTQALVAVILARRCHRPDLWDFLMIAGVTHVCRDFVRLVGACGVRRATWVRPKTYPPRAHSEMALELVSGADFWCKLMSGGRPVDLGGSRGRFPG